MFLSFCFLVFTLDTLQKCVNDDTTNDNKNLNDYNEDDDGDYMIQCKDNNNGSNNDDNTSMMMMVMTIRMMILKIDMHKMMKRVITMI